MENDRDPEQIFYTLGSLLETYAAEGYRVTEVSTESFDISSAAPLQAEITVEIPVTEMVAAPMVDIEGFNTQISEAGGLPVTFTVTLHPEETDTETRDPRRLVKESREDQPSVIAAPLHLKSCVESSSDGKSKNREGEQEKTSIQASAETEIEVEKNGLNTTREATSDALIEEESDDVKDLDLPPYKDPEKLRSVYGEYDTFAEMTESLHVDVTPQTVRKYMIDLGIHKPEPRMSNILANHAEKAEGSRLKPSTTAEPKQESKNDEQTESQQQRGSRLITDSTTEGSKSDETKQRASELANEEASETSIDEEGSEEDRDDPVKAEIVYLDAQGKRGTEESHEPAEYLDLEISDILENLDDSISLTIGELASAVQDAKTMYEVEKQVGIEKETLRTILKQLGLLEVVSGRLANKDETPTTRSVIQQHICTIVERRLSESE